MSTAGSEPDVLTIGGTVVSGPPQRSAGMYFPTLDGYRAIAAISVVAFHCVAAIGGDSGQWYSPYTNPLGGFGVAIFFVLSGFLLYRPFALTYLRGESAPSLRSYYTRRFFRILPGYWFALIGLFFIFGQAQSSPHDGGAYFTFFSLTQIYRGPGWVTAGLYVAWTLCVEVSFYVALPIIAFVVRGIGRSTKTLRGRVQVQISAMAVLYVGSVVWRIINVEYFPGLANQRGWLPGYLDYFALGMTFAVVSCSLELGGVMPKVLGWCARWPAIPLFFAAELYFFEMRTGNPGLFVAATTTRQLLHPALFSAAAALLLMPGIFGPAGKGVWRRMLSSRVMTLLGLISFGIYLWHPIWLAEIQDQVQQNKYDRSFWAVFPPVLVLSIATATLSYLLVEAPAMRLGRRIERLWKGPPKASSRADAPPAGAPASDPAPATQPRVAASSAAASSASTAASHV